MHDETSLQDAQGDCCNELEKAYLCKRDQICLVRSRIPACLVYQHMLPRLDCQHLQVSRLPNL